MTKPLEKVNVAFAEIFKGSCFHHVKMSLYISNVHEGKISFPCQICGKAFVVKHSRVHESTSLPMSNMGQSKNFPCLSDKLGKNYRKKVDPRTVCLNAEFGKIYGEKDDPRAVLA